MTTLNIDSGEFFQRLDQSRADNPVGLRPRDVSYLICYLTLALVEICNGRSRQDASDPEKWAKPKISVFARL